MSAYRRSKFTFNDYSSTPAYHSGIVASSAASLTRTSLTSNPISSLALNCSSAAAANSRTRYTPGSYASSSSKLLTSTTTSTRPLMSSSAVTSTFTTRSPRLQSYLNARELDAASSSRTKTPGYASSTSWRSRASEMGSTGLDAALGSSRSRSYSHSGLYKSDEGYRSRSSSVRDTSPYDPERDRDLVMSMRSQSAMSSRAASRDRSAYASALLDDYTSGYSKPDPMLTSMSVNNASSSLSGSKKYGGGEDCWSEATWINNLRLNAGMDPIPMPSSSAASKSLAYEAISTLPRMMRSNSSHDLRDLDLLTTAAGSARMPVKSTSSRARHQTLAYGVSASDLTMMNSRNNDLMMMGGGGFNSSFANNGSSDHDIFVARVPSREGEVYDVRGFESDMSAAIMNARSRRHSLDNEIVELHPPLVTFASIDAEDPYQPMMHPSSAAAAFAHNQPPPPPAPYDHKNMVFVNKNDLESILVKGAHAQQQVASAAAVYKVPSSADNNSTIVQGGEAKSSFSSNNNNNPTSIITASSANRGGNTASDRSQNGEIDYRKLWEQSQMDNSKLRDDLARTRDELSAARKKLDTVVQAPPSSSGLTDSEKKEKMALEKKLSEMEEELKQLEHLKNDNQRLRDENGALIRVISKLSK